MAFKCRTLAKGVSDDEMVRALNSLAHEYEAKAKMSERKTASALSPGDFSTP
jgi:hypothetical protein